MLLFLLLSVVVGVSADTEGPPPHMMVAQRIISSIPDLPTAIQSSIEGKPDTIKTMISSALGDGLISQLVFNPVGVAEEMGVNLEELGVNKTEMLTNLDAVSGGLASEFQKKNSSVSGSLFGRNPLLGAFSTTPKPTTEAVIYVDGVPMKDFDNFVRNHGLEDKISTKHPITTTSPPANPDQIADAVMAKLRQRQNAPAAPPPHSQDLANTIDMGLVDPKRVNEVNSILRRAPTRFDTLTPNAQSFVQAPLDPTVDEVVTQLRTKANFGGISVDEVKKLQAMLQTYEQTLQTQELLSKRKQLQVLQVELTEQRKRIDLQKRMEEELRRKEKELDEKRKKMELQLQEQLTNWHTSFNPPGRSEVPFPAIDLPESNPNEFPTLASPSSAQIAAAGTHEVHRPSSNEQSHQVHRPASNEDSTVPSAGTTKRTSTISLPKPIMSSMRMRPHRMPPSNPIQREEAISEEQQEEEDEVEEQEEEEEEVEEEFSSDCECQQISLDKMKGQWVVALASQNMVSKLYAGLSSLLRTNQPSVITCSRMEVFSPKQSSVAQDARIQWSFRTENSNRMYKLNGNALTMDHRTLRLQMKDFHGGIFSVPMCVLKYGGTYAYEYMVVTNGNGPCAEAALLVRDPEHFFDHTNVQLVQYFKKKLARREMDAMEVVSFANNCS